MRPGRDISPRHSRRRRASGRTAKPATGRREGKSGSARTSPRAAPPRSGRSALALLGPWTRPLARFAILAAELGAVGVLVTRPAFASTNVEVGGIHHLTRPEVLRRTGLDRHPSVFLVAPDALETVLRGDPYVRSVRVDTSLPGRVQVSVQEWAPRAVITFGTSAYLLNEEGTVLGPAAQEDNGRLQVVAPARPATAPGQRVLLGRLLGDMLSMQASFPARFGLHIARFELDADQALVAVTEGPRILFGQMVTREQLESLDAKLAALNSLPNRANLAHANLDYINLMNPRQPALHEIPPPPSPTPSARPGTHPTPSPSPTH